MITTFDADDLCQALFPEVPPPRIAVFKTPRSGFEIGVTVLKNKISTLKIDATNQFDKHDLKQLGEMLIKLSDKMLTP